MIKLIDLLVEKYKISDKEAEILSFLAHDKKHVSQYSNVVDKIITSNLERSTVPLYRGFGPRYNIGTLSTGKYIGQVFKIGDVLGFSENIQIAKNFGKDSKIILKVVDGVGFCYWKWYVKQIKKEMSINKNDKESNLEFIDFLLKEKEWLLPKESKFKILDVESTDSYSIINCSQI